MIVLKGPAIILYNFFKYMTCIILRGCPLRKKQITSESTTLDMVVKILLNLGMLLHSIREPEFCLPYFHLFLP